jgi:hypothetical protein
LVGVHRTEGRVKLVALRKFVGKLTKPVHEQDLEQLTSWCDMQGGANLKGIEARHPVFVAGEVRSVRIVPRAGADAMEATVMDGRGAITVVFLGRRRIVGFTPGRRVTLEGVISVDGPERYMYNPVYTLS